MPASFETLPNNVLNQIVLFSQDTTDLVRSTMRIGKTLTLVCKALKRFGRTVVWCALNLDYSKLEPSNLAVFSAFERHKQLHPLVKAVFIQSSGEDSSFQDYEVSPIQVARKILKACQNIDSVALAFSNRPPNSQYVSIFSLVAFLPRLTTVHISACSIALNPDAIQALLTGFPLATNLQLELYIPPSMDTTYVKTLKSVPSPVRELEIDLSVASNLSLIPHLLRVFDRAFELDGIESVQFGPRFIGITPLAWLSTLPALRTVALTLEPKELVYALPTIASSLHLLPTVATFTINRKMPHRGHSEHSLLSRIPLSSVLSAIPSSLYIFSIKGIHFRGPLSYPQLRIKRSLLSQTEGPTVQCYFEQSVSRQLVRLKKMRDSKGVLRWYQIIEI